MRRGFTLLETLVALLLFQVGMLAVAATGAVAAREVAAARRAAEARAAARNRIESLRPAVCASAASHASTVVAPGIEEHWRVGIAGSSRDVTDSVVYTLPAGRRGTLVLRAAVLCP
jgi:Tfp pilus assembly protein PilV